MQRLDYASPHPNQSRVRILLRIARFWAVVPLCVGVFATVGYWITRHDLFAIAGALAGVAGVAGVLAIPALAVAASVFADKERTDVVDRHAATSMIIMVVTLAVGFVCLVLTVRLFEK